MIDCFVCTKIQVKAQQANSQAIASFYVYGLLSAQFFLLSHGVEEHSSNLDKLHVKYVGDKMHKYNHVQ